MVTGLCFLSYGCHYTQNNNYVHNHDIIPTAISLRLVMFHTELIDSVASYVQFIIGHDESNTKGIRVAKNLENDVCACVCTSGNREVGGKVSNF